MGVKVIPGVELSATDKTNNQEIHLICYLPDFPDRLEGLCSRNSQFRKRSTHYMMLKVAQRYPVTTEFVAKCAAGSTNIYKVHIMQALLEMGFTDKIYSDLYDELFNPASENSINHSPEYQDVFEVLTAIHDAGGIAVLTHPFRSKNPELLDKLVEAGLDGIEVYTPNMSAEQKAELIKYAKAHKLLTTGGTNFKGLYNKHILSVGDCDLPDECVNELLTYKSRQKKAQRKAAQAKANEKLQEAIKASK
jgi:predicted metal-dependent phosphoesterase TrpH